MMRGPSPPNRKTTQGNIRYKYGQLVSESFSGPQGLRPNRLLQFSLTGFSDAEATTKCHKDGAE